MARRGIIVQPQLSPMPTRAIVDHHLREVSGDWRDRGQAWLSCYRWMQLLFAFSWMKSVGRWLDWRRPWPWSNFKFLPSIFDFWLWADKLEHTLCVTCTWGYELIRNGFMEVSNGTITVMKPSLHSTQHIHRNSTFRHHSFFVLCSLYLYPATNYPTTHHH